MGPPGAPGGPLSREPLYLSLSELGRRKIVRKDLGGVFISFKFKALMGGGLTHSQTGTAQSGWPSTADRHTACRHCRRPFLHQPPDIAQFNYFFSESGFQAHRILSARRLVIPRLSRLLQETWGITVILHCELILRLIKWYMVGPC